MFPLGSSSISILKVPGVLTYVCIAHSLLAVKKRSVNSAYGAEPGAEYPTAVGLGPGAATARLERRLHLDAVDRADLTVRAYLCGVGRVDLGAELELDRGAAAP
jgi:hypothetical protein